MISPFRQSAVHPVSFGEAVRINENWRFSREGSRSAKESGFDDRDWRWLDLPHDWTVEGPYNADLASATGYLPGGIGWYRKTLWIPEERRHGRVYLYFEGVYRNGETFINGQSLGMRPNGYVSYLHDLSPHLRFGEENTLAVSVDHRQFADSRWYTGSGIYRDVYLVYAGLIHIAPWGVRVTTPRIIPEQADIEVETSVMNTTGRESELEVVHELFDDHQNLVAGARGHLIAPGGEVSRSTLTFPVDDPARWSLASPNLYQLRTTLLRDGEPIDATRTTIGIRELRFDPDRGFFLNGEPTKVKGVCLHHDAGSLGAAVPTDVWIRRLETLKTMGVNAIRTSHNPQAPVLYDLCDEMGLLVLNEAFDEWEFPKKKWIEGWNAGAPGYDGHAEFFREWAETDLADMVRRDRNHPSVFLWSIGNEVDYPNDPYSHPILDEEGIGQQHELGFLPDRPHAERLGAIAQRLAAVVRKHDPSRPVTAALAGPVMSNETAYPSALDVVGYNYTEDRYEQDHRTYPKRVLYGSENRHLMADWKAARDNAFIFGQFLWTGIDYLGEARPWPSRGSGAGLIDLAGFKKPRGWFRQSLWSNDPVIFIGTYPAPAGAEPPSIDANPAWNYRAGEIVRVAVYTNCKQAELRLNGEIAAERKTRDDETGVLYWDIPYAPGKLEAIGYDDERETVRGALETSGAPHAIAARAWRKRVAAERGVAQIEIQIIDREGRPVFESDAPITCATEGPVRLLGMEAANPADMGDYQGNCLRAYRGRMIVYAEALGEAGSASVRLTSPGLESSEVKFELEE